MKFSLQPNNIDVQEKGEINSTLKKFIKRYIL